MAAPTGTVWGSIAGSTDSRGARLGLYVSLSNTDTKTSVTVQVWFWSKYGVSDTSNNLYFDNTSASSSAATDKGAVSISTTVSTGDGWSTSNQVKIATYTYSYTRTTAAQKRYLYSKLTGVDRVAATLYASTTFTVPALASYTVSYDANGGAGAPSSQTKWYGTSLVLSSTKPTRTGYTFKNWISTTQNQAYNPGNSYGHNASTTMKAQWTANTYTVSYDANGGSGAPSAQTKTYGAALTLSSTKPTRANYNFIGWAASASATTAAYTAGGSYTDNAAITLYAVWELAYTPPRINDLSITRSGANAVVSFSWATDKTVSSIKAQWASVSNSGSANISASGTSGTVNQTVGGGALSVDSAYTITVTVADASGSTSESRTLNGTAFPVDFLSGGKGVAFGKEATKQNAVEADWDVYANKNLHIGGTAYDRFNTSIPNGLAAYTSAGIDPDTTLEPLILTHLKTPMPTAGQFVYIWTVFYNTKSTSAARAQFAVPYMDRGSMYHRYYYGGAWSEWRRHANGDELDDYLPLTAGSGKAVTGPLYLAGQLHTQQIKFYNDGSNPAASGAATAGAVLCTANNIYFDAHSGRGFRFRTVNNSQLEALRIDKDGSIVIPGVYHLTTTGTANLLINSSGTLYRTTSLRKSKTDIKDVTEEEANKAYDLRPRSFKGIQEGVDDYSQYGFIAEEVEEVLPKLTTHDEEGLSGVAYDRVTTVLLKQNQMQKADIETLKVKADKFDKLTALLVSKGILTKEEVEAL